MTSIRNIYACLVHEKPACIVDLVRNLRYLDPSSPILLYNGGADKHLLHTSFPFESYGALVYPKPRRLRWGKLHDFALDCMRFALENIPFDTLTIVDSDQLAVRPGYPAVIARTLDGRSDIGLLGSEPALQGPNTTIPPAKTAQKEIELWRPFLQRFPHGEERYVHWTFWPSTVFTSDAARQLTQLFDTNAQLQDILRRTKIWATEEIILPTLVALLGYRIEANPCSYDYVKYRVTFSRQQIDAALSRTDVFWVHPVERKTDNVLRKQIRDVFQQYEPPGRMRQVTSATEGGPGLVLTMPILSRMKQVEGWLEEEEADLLISVLARALSEAPGEHNIVEVGSYCGRATVVLGSVVKAVRADARIYAIDPHDGKLGAVDQGIRTVPPSKAKFQRNMAAAGLTDIVELIPKKSSDVEWHQPICFVLIDGLHDYASVAADFYHFEPWLTADGYVAFHDYADYYPGVKLLVHELLGTGGYRVVHCVHSMLVLQKLAENVPHEVERTRRPDRQVEKTNGDRSRAGRIEQTHEERSHAGHEKAHADRGSAGHITKTHADRRRAGDIEKAHGRTVREDSCEGGAAAVISGGEPLVSCIMPTADRPAFARQAVRYFMRQNYPNLELIIVDDGSEPATDMPFDDPRIRCIRLEGRHTIGTKRNVAVREAKGDLIAHWDDDDWAADWRLQYQVESLLGAQADICGLDAPLFCDPRSERAWQYVYPPGRSRWVYGATFCYTRAFWSRNPFPEISVGEDNRFISGKRGTRILALEDNTFYVGLIHPRNSSRKRTSGNRWHSYPIGSLQQLMQEDWGFYDAMLGEH